MSVVKVCAHCGKEFNTPNRRSEQVKFCSRECKTKAGNKQVECAHCKKPFSCEAHKVRRYCSRACFHAGAKGSKHAVDPNQQRYHKVCEVCGKEFRVTLTRKDIARFCSRDCQSASPEFKAEMSAKMSGEKNWRWAGGLYKNHGGYIRHKKKVLGTETVTLNHRQVVLAEMVKTDPDHPFIIVIDGERKLSPEIEVHHIDRVRSNNAPSNLLAVTKAAHAQIHHRGRKPKPWECWPSDPTAW